MRIWGSQKDIDHFLDIHGMPSSINDNWIKDVFQML